MNRALERPLISNGFMLSTAPDRLGWLEPTDPSLPVERLKEQFRAQGYLWLKGILNRDEVLAFRRRFFAAFQGIGLLAPESDPVDGIYSGVEEDKEAARHVLTEAVRWAAYEAFCLSRPIIEFYEKFLGGPVYLHKRKLIRYTKPGDPNCTGAHYDLTYLRAGTERVYTSWIPIGDIPVEMGGLLYLEGSDAWGRQMEAEFSARNADLPPEERISAYNRNMALGGWLTKDLPSLADRLNTRWLVADYEAGDMVVHSAYIIHAASMNQDPLGRMRLSTDIRYQLVSDPIDRRWTNDWSPDDNL
ncbi:MAG: phytanoyl-CoA dioxygenase family protein [Anaerolineae bacterium]|nr:phytanoyl-CoA dioxygenase family protein [Anaerolineae bacterium]MDW8100519.1 phytanoyl-CoA dioxygenase family protein [Anaerolineae bacterium]